MGSTIGGLLAGAGLTLLLLSASGMYMIQGYGSVYNQVMSSKTTVMQLGTLLNSSLIDNLLNSYDNLTNLTGNLDPLVTGYEELAGILPQFGTMISTYRNLSALVPKLDNMSQSYAVLYPQILQLEGNVTNFYDFTHSQDYNTTLTNLHTLAGALSNSIVTMAIGDQTGRVNAAISNMENAQVITSSAMSIIKTIELFPPGELQGYLNQLKTAIAAFPPDTASDYYSRLSQLVETYPPSTLSNYISQVKDLATQVPSATLRSYMSQARSAVSNALQMYQVVEQYSPDKFQSYLVIGLGLGGILAVGGIALIIMASRASKKGGPAGAKSAEAS